jgi:intermediate peptidase
MFNEQGNLGFMYLDLYSRKGKYPGCAHFAIRGGRRLQDSNYQLPVCSLVYFYFMNNKGIGISKH